MNRALKGAVVLVALALAAPLAHPADTALTLSPGSKLRLTGTSTVHEYAATASRLDASFGLEAAAWSASLPRGEAIERVIRERGVTSLEVTVPVTGLHSGKDGLDKNMYKALLATKYPEIRFVMSGYKVAEGSKPGETAIDARGKLTIAGVEKELGIAATAVREGDAVRLRGTVPLKMTTFGIKPPTMMMGTLRTSDDVTIHFDLLVDGAPPADAKGASR
jgi:polyisoprenoid-binding protein YceI